MNIDYAVEYRGEWGPVSGELLHDIAPHLAHVATFAVNRGYALDAFWWTECTPSETASSRRSRKSSGGRSSKPKPSGGISD